VWVNRRGEASPTLLAKAAYGDPRLSPDGRRLAATVNGRDVLVYDLARGTSVRLTPDESEEFEPVWTRDGQRVTFSSTAGGVAPNLFWAPADGSRPMERLASSALAQFANGWTPDGKTHFFTTSSASGESDVSLLHVDGSNRTIEKFLDGPANEWTPKISPDGRWLAHLSDESGRTEVYVRPYPARDPKVPISSDGGSEPRWSRDGRELFYRNGDRMMAVAISTESGFTASKPVMLFEVPYELTAPGYPNYDVADDGRFLMIKRSEQESPLHQLNVVVNWFEELKRRVRVSQ
jgi:serine/threonine-protein kinase